jgi:hypothetical protein
MKAVFRRRWYLFSPLILAGIAIFGFITMYLWNVLLTVIFHFPEINFWQALGLLVLTRLLFGGFGGHRQHHNTYWRKNWHEKWNNMSQEERENFMKNHKFSNDWCGQPGKKD